MRIQHNPLSLREEFLYVVSFKLLFTRFLLLYEKFSHQIWVKLFHTRFHRRVRDFEFLSVPHAFAFHNDDSDSSSKIVEGALRNLQNSSRGWKSVIRRRRNERARSLSKLIQFAHFFLVISPKYHPRRAHHINQFHVRCEAHFYALFFSFYDWFDFNSPPIYHFLSPPNGFSSSSEEEAATRTNFSGLPCFSAFITAFLSFPTHNGKLNFAFLVNLAQLSIKLLKDAQTSYGREVNSNQLANCIAIIFQEKHIKRRKGLKSRPSPLNSLVKLVNNKAKETRLSSLQSQSELYRYTVQYN